MSALKKGNLAFESQERELWVRHQLMDPFPSGSEGFPETPAKRQSVFLLLIDHP